MDLCIRLPEPLLCIIEKRHGLLGCSYFLTNSINRAENLKHAWADLDAVQRRCALEQLGAPIGTMHRGGFRHGDLKWGNIPLLHDTGIERLYFIDFDGSLIYSGPLQEPKARKDLARFFVDLRCLDGSRENEQKFLDAWTPAFCRVT